MNAFVRKYALAVLLLAILFLLVRGDLLSASLPVLVGQLAALLLAGVSRAAFRQQQFRISADPGSGRLIQHGPYTFIRHPMYAAALLFLWSTIAGHWSWINGGIGLLVTATILLRIAAEETLLRANYPEYETYARRTRRLIPFLY